MRCAEAWEWVLDKARLGPAALQPLPHCSLPQLPLLEDKLRLELPAGARVVAGRFPLPTWQPVAVAGEGLDRVWAYDVDMGVHRARPAAASSWEVPSPGPGSA